MWTWHASRGREGVVRLKSHTLKSQFSYTALTKGKKEKGYITHLLTMQANTKKKDMIIP